MLHSVGVRDTSMRIANKYATRHLEMTVHRRADRHQKYMLGSAGQRAEGSDSRNYSFEDMKSRFG